jgi:hypothetical protein
LEIIALVGQGRGKRLALLEAVQHQFDTAGNSQLFEDSEEVISHDSGSSMLGFASALLGLAFCRETGPAKSALTSILFSVLVAALPLIDAGVAILRRMRQRASPLYGDRRHFYDLLLARGYTARQVALVCYAITGSLVIAGWFILRLENREALISSVLIGCTLFAKEVRMGAMRSRETPQKDLTKEDLRWRELADHALRERV